MRKVMVLLLAAVMLLGGCAAPAPKLERYTYSFYDTFDTVVILTGYAPDQATFDHAAEVCEREFRRYHEMFTAYRHSENVNNVWELNEAAWKAPMQVEPEMMELLQLCMDQYAISTAVNPAMGRVLRLWHTAREDAEIDPYTAYIPGMEALREANEHTAITDLILDPDAMTVYYADPLLRLDLGAVAKGFAAGKVAEKVAEIVPVFSINAGGNIVLGKKYNDGGWKIGIQHPDAALFTDENQYICTLQAENCAVVTSGDYQRYFYAEGRAWHHLIDPETLLPAEHCRSVTIVAPTSALADWYSTAAFILPYEESRALIGSREGIEALWYLPDGTVEMTDGFAKLMLPDEAK